MLCLTGPCALLPLAASALGSICLPAAPLLSRSSKSGRQHLPCICPASRCPVPLQGCPVRRPGGGPADLTCCDPLPGSRAWPGSGYELHLRHLKNLACRARAAPGAATARSRSRAPPGDLLTGDDEEQSQSLLISKPPAAQVAKPTSPKPTPQAPAAAPSRATAQHTGEQLLAVRPGNLARLGPDLQLGGTGVQLAGQC